MAFAKRAGLAVAAGLSVTLLVAACGGSGGSTGNQSSSATSSSSGGQTGSSSTGSSDNSLKGGTATVYLSSDFEHLDPARNYVTNSGTWGQVLTPTLMAFKTDYANGNKETLVPDLAAAEPTHSKDNKTWTFKLKSGVKYQDGTTVTAADVKYNVERSFAPDMQEGAPYGRDYVACQKGYAGPYKPAGAECSGISTPNSTTIIFHLNRPVSDFDNTASMYTFAAVPKAHDTHQSYDSHVWSYGPYMIQSYTRNKELILVRNKSWNQANDPINQANPDEFDLKMGANADTVSKQLIQDNVADQASFDGDTSVGSSDISKLGQANVKDRVWKGTDPCRRYVAFNFQNKYLGSDKNLRLAMTYATNRTNWLLGRGGTTLNASVPSIIPQGLPGYDANSAPQMGDSGDMTKAKQYLAMSNYAKEGKPTLELSTSNASARAIAAATSLQASWKALGVNVSVKQINGDNYYTLEQADKSASDLIIAGWCYDWPALSSVIAPVLGFQYGTSTPSLNNYSRYNGSSSWALQRQANSATSSSAATALYIKAYAAAMADAPLVPLSKDLGVFVVGKKIKNAYIYPLSGLIDPAVVAVSKS